MFRDLLIADFRYLTSSQPWRSYRDHTQVSQSWVVVQFTVHIPHRCNVEEDFENQQTNKLRLSAPGSN